VTRGRAVAGLILLLGLVLVVPAISAAALPGTATEVAPQVMAATADGGRTSVVVFMAQQADLHAPAALSDKVARGRAVYRALTAQAARSQAPLTSWLTARGVAFQSFWVANMLVLDADRTLVEQLAARHDVARVDANTPLRGIEEPSVAAVSAAVSAASAVEPGVADVRAPDVWAEGDTGAGIVIGSADTGVRWTHTAIKNQYRGWNGVTADHNYNWHDAVHTGGGVCGPDTLAPCDDSGHGTHTVGSAVGDDGSGNQIGVAPAAQWIGCRNMDQGTGTPASYTECFQFFLAPTDLTGANPNPDLRPDIATNSWVCPASEGCSTGAELEAVVNSLAAAGIFVVAAAGNFGPNCSTVEYPPGMYAAAMSVGAIDASDDTLASFSSRGPSLYYNPPLLKPEIAAPGVNVRSAWRTSDSAYAWASGTSMAAPHVAGVVALLWADRPELIGDIGATRAVLEASANAAVTVDPPEQCGGTNSWDIPNNSFGYGRVDALAAIGQAVPSPTPSPTATASPTAATVPGAPTSVTASAGDASAQVSWQAPSTDGGSPITGYTVSASSGGQTCTTSGALLCTVSGLTNGKSYTFTVRAANQLGSGPPSAPSNQVTPQAVDTTAPITATPVVTFANDQPISQQALMHVAWPAASDPSGIARYDLVESTNGGAWTAVSLSSPTATSVDLWLTAGSYYSFGLRATDGAGNTGGYATTPTEKLGRSQEKNWRISYSSGWRRVALNGALGGHVKRAKTAGANASYKFTGSAIAYVSTLGPNRGIVELWLDGTKVATVDLYAATLQPARVVWTSAALVDVSHTLQVRVTGTHNPSAINSRVDIDAFVRLF
jgi:serine protease AprX